MAVVRTLLFRSRCSEQGFSIPFFAADASLEHKFGLCVAFWGCCGLKGNSQQLNLLSGFLCVQL